VVRENECRFARRKVSASYDVRCCLPYVTRDKTAADIIIAARSRSQIHASPVGVLLQPAKATRCVFFVPSYIIYRQNRNSVMASRPTPLRKRATLPRNRAIVRARRRRNVTGAVLSRVPAPLNVAARR